MNRNPINRNHGIIYVTLILISLIYLLVTPIGVDMPFHVMRIGELGNELARGGAFPVYMFRDLYSYYGYPIPLFYCSVLLYPFALLTICGVSALTAYKLMVLCVMWMIYGISHACISRIKGFDTISTECAFIYTIQPFVLNELFVRSSIGSAAVFVFVPIVMLGLYYMWHCNNSDMSRFNMISGVLCLGGGMAMIIMSHVISAFLLLFLVAVIVILCLAKCHNRLNMVIFVLAGAFVCILLSSWYVFPVIEQFADQTYKSQTVTWLQIGAENPVSILIPMHLITLVSHLMNTDLRISEIGGAPVPVLIMTIYLFRCGRIFELKKQERIILVTYYILCVILFIPFIWDRLGYILGFMQFGWRIFLIITLVGCAFTIICIKHHSDDSPFVHTITSIYIASSVYVLIFMFGYFAIRNMAPDLIGNTVGHAVDKFVYAAETDDDLYIPDGMDEDELIERERTVYLISETDITSDSFEYSYELDTHSGAVDVYISRNQSNEVVKLEIPFIYYKGYEAVNTDTDVKYEVKKGANNMVNIEIDPGETGHIIIKYQNTITQSVTFLISITSFGILIIIQLLMRFVHCAYNTPYLKEK